MHLVNPEGRRCCREPGCRTLRAEGEGGVDAYCASVFQSARGFTQERLCQQIAGVRADGRQGASAARRQHADMGNAQFGKEPEKLVLHDIGECTDHHQRRSGSGCFGRHFRHKRGQTGVFAFGEGRFDPAARISEDSHALAGFAAQMLRAEALRGVAEIELDDFGRAGADEEQRADFRTPRQQPVDHAGELRMAIGQTRQIALFDDRRGKARLGEDHHARCRLEQVGACARANDEEECILHLAVQPDNAGQTAEDFTLAAFAQHGKAAVTRVFGSGEGLGRAHAATPAPMPCSAVDFA